MTEPYRPSNGSEGESFMATFCQQCARDAAHREDPELGLGCPIILNAMAFDIGHPKYPSEWVTGENGARCTAFVQEGETIPPARCGGTGDLFPAGAESV